MHRFAGMGALMLLLLAGFSAGAAENVLVSTPDEKMITLRNNHDWHFKADPTAGRITVRFKHRLDFPRLAGWCPCWQIQVNGQLVTPQATRSYSRLLNKPQDMTHVDHGNFQVADGTKWYSLYSPDYTSAEKKFYPKTPEAYRVVLDITDFVKKDQDNIVKLRFGAELESYYKKQGLKRKPALGVIDFQIVQDTDVQSPLAPHVEPPVYIVTGPAPQVKYTWKSTPENVTVEVPGAQYQVESSFSLPGGGFAKLGGNQLKTKFYTVKREIRDAQDHLTVFDTITNTTDRLIGLKIDYSTALNGADPVYVAGDALPSRTKVEDGRNPSVFLAWPQHKSGIGLLAEDDVFRVQNIQYCQKGRAGIKSETFALSPGETRTVEWSIYPTASSDYFDFINAVRRNWDVNFTIKGGFHISLNAFVNYTPEKSRKLVDDLGLYYNALGVLFWRHMGGEYAKRANEVHGAALLDDECRGMLLPSTPTTFKVEPMRDWVRLVFATARKHTPKLKVLLYTHNQLSYEIDDFKKYPNDFLSEENLKPHVLEQTHYFIPTDTNAYGKNYMRLIRFICSEYDVDGIYQDEINYSHKRKTYNMWDQVSVELNKQNEVTRKIGYVPLLKLKFTLGVMDYVINERKLEYVGNFAPETRSERRFKFPRFEETYNSNWVFLSHLYTPIQLGDMLTYGNTPTDGMADIRNALKHGALYYHYSNTTMAPTISRQMFPFTPVEIHSGYLIGRERILTIYSGEYGISGERKPYKALVYGPDGKLVPDHPYENKDTADGMKCKIILPKNYCAVLIKQ